MGGIISEGDSQQQTLPDMDGDCCWEDDADLFEAQAGGERRSGPARCGAGVR